MWDPRTLIELRLVPFAREVFSFPGWGWFFTFSRDEQGQVVGFTINTVNLRNLQFVRR